MASMKFIANTKYKILKIFLSEQMPEPEGAIVFNKDSNMSEASLPDLDSRLDAAK